MSKPEGATHYSKKMDAYFIFDNAYFIFDNAYFIWCDLKDEWIEFTAIGHIKDLEELK